MEKKSIIINTKKIILIIAIIVVLLLIISIIVVINNSYTKKELQELQEVTEQNEILIPSSIIISNVNIEKLRYLLIDITEVRDLSATMQMSEWCLFDKNYNQYIYSPETKIVSNLEGNINFRTIEKIDNLIDGDINTKYCTDMWSNNYKKISKDGSCIIIIDLGKTFNLNDYPYYSYYTGNDYEDRDPVSWTIYGSDNGINYTVIDSRNKINPPTDRNKMCDYWTYNYNN